jgi:zinc/manganese transport system permease protein
MKIIDLFFPFFEFEFLNHALIASIVLSISAAPLGVFLLLKRLSLIGDALSHSILPGVAVGYFLFGFSLPGMTVGGFLAGILIILVSQWVSQKTNLKQETSFATFYLISLALGVLLISAKGSQVDLIHVLFGNLLSLDQPTLNLIMIVMSITIVFFGLAFKPLVLEAFDQEFYQLKVMRFKGWKKFLLQGIPFFFLIILVLNLVSSFHAIGTLLSLGLIVLPAATASLWVKTIGKLIMFSLAISLLGCYSGILLSYHFDLAIGPTIVACIGVIYIVSLIGRKPVTQFFKSQSVTTHGAQSSL